MAGRSGHSYTNSIVSDQARAHLGDVYNNYGPSPDEKSFRSILESLRYDGMDDRRDRLNNAERGTFEWTLAEERCVGDEAGEGLDQVTGTEDFDESDTSKENDSEDELDSWDSDSDHEIRSWTIDTSFATWLEGEKEDLFCFFGKPGSGKSTLMYVRTTFESASTSCADIGQRCRKFLATNPRVDQLLETWAKGKQLLRAEHFFWILGGHVQKTIEGLLRHLLYCTILSMQFNAHSNKLELVMDMLGSGRTSSNSQRAWCYEELYDILVRLVDCSHTKFFFLVDALDENEPQNRLWALAEEVWKISQLPNIKICVSCRPWTVFVSNISQAQTLHLDKMTLPDMKLYIKNRLAHVGARNDICSQFSADSPTIWITKFIARMARAAEGVFLWSELVMEALSSEMRKDCDFEQLEEVLDEFPLGLDEYFQRLIFDRITKTRKNISDTAAALMLAMQILEYHERGYRFSEIPYSDSFLNFWLLRSGYLGPGFSWTDHEDTQYTPDDAQRMVVQTNDFLEETCKGLLVTVDCRDRSSRGWSELEWDVEFLHRTVSDFIRGDKMKLLIEQRSPDHFRDDRFVEELGKLRCTSLLHEMYKTCREAEYDWRDILFWSTKLPIDQLWLADCEALVIARHKRSCECLGLEHTLFHEGYTFECARTRSLEYMLTIMRSWPRLAIKYGSLENLGGFFSGWLTHIIEECTGNVAERSDRGIDHESSSSQPAFAVRSGLSEVQSIWHVVLQSCFGTTARESHMILLNQLLYCGLDVNQQHLEDLTHHSRPHRGSIWQNWLRLVYLKIKQEGPGPFSLGDSLERFKRKISDIALAFLQNGADPTSTTCISFHISKETCPIKMPVEAVLKDITSYDVLGRAYASRNTESFNLQLARRGCMIKAIKSWTVTARELYALTPDNATTFDDEVADFMFGLARNTFGQFCSSCETQVTEYEVFLMAACIDCLEKYQLCDGCIRNLYLRYPDLDNLSRHVVHKVLPPDRTHTLFCFGHSRSGDFIKWHGVQAALSVLKDWYSRNLNSTDTAVD